jgi:uncharacterized protein YpuA (DUF1002 family)
LKQWTAEINSFKGTLVGLGGDGYVDEEEKIREEISESYRLISNYPGMPTDTQIAKVKSLHAKMEKIKKRFDQFISQLDEWNKKFEKAGLKTIEIQSKETFLQ